MIDTDIVKIVFEKLFPLLTLFLGWALSQYSIQYRDKVLELRKVNRLLYHLIELRQILNKESQIELFLKKFDDILKSRLPNTDPKHLKEAFERLKPDLGEFIKRRIINIDKISELEVSIDSLISEISEVDPVFACELSEKQNIKVQLRDLHDYFKVLENKDKGLYYDNLSEKNVNPIIKNKFIIELDRNILILAKKTDKKSYKKVEKLIELPFVIDENEIIEYFGLLIRIR